MVQIKQAALDNANANLGYCKICSPVDGIVISRSIDLGQTVASSFNTPTLFQIANDLTKMQIDSSVAEADIGSVVNGQSAISRWTRIPIGFSRQGHAGAQFAHNVNNVVTYDCVISVTNSDYKLKPGMTANISFIVAEHENALSIPNAALRFHPPDYAVVVTNSAAASMGRATASILPARPAGRAIGAVTPMANARFFTPSFCFPARVAMRSCSRCRSGPASPTAFRPR